MDAITDLFGFDNQDTQPVVSISASQSLNESEFSREPITTGLPRFDQALNTASFDPQRAGGILRGQITEVFGPPGVGKTALALNIASHALRDGDKVIWIDTSSPLPKPRLEELNPSTNTNWENLIYFRTPTLPHLLALLCNPPKEFPPPETTLLIIDSVSSLFPSYFPNAAELKDRQTQGKITDKAQLQWLLNRKWNVSSDLATHLARLASRGIAVLAINQAHTKIKGQPRATLQPVLAGGGWDSSVQTRVAMYRDLPDKRYMEITKRAGKTFSVRMADMIIGFRIDTDGLHEIVETEQRSPELSRKKTAQPIEETPCRKRKASDEIADSQDEESDEEYD
ncbi:hypothetical protein N7478_011458 [Penicillium angulare]|uniref:uncharacterized protein n=1 Tax=Penicillium angulare TaxID=116970 RepID=UPI00253F93B2|nr:uncharacterized protein N7478_011458 [Penicillium angulare]KAJ5263853.1 hypothetical protein N7478_011458 [Penicillium angulare]